MPTMQMPRSFKYGPLLVALAACGSGRAVAQTPAPSADGASLEHVYAYEVPSNRAAQVADTGVVRVNGNASVDVAPDRAVVSFAVVTEADDASDAAAANAEAMTRVLAAVRATGVPGLEVETFGYNLNPRYTTATENGTRVQRIDGYRASNNVRATTSDVNAVGRIIDAAIGAGANRVAGLSFVASDTREARLQALRLAVEAAREQAEAIAMALGRRLGPAIEVNGGAESPRPPMPYARDMAVMESAAPTPIEAGDQTVYANVSITFALGPATSGR